MLPEAFGAREARAMCNVIPAATADFRSAAGSTNRPFASPGDYVEVRVRPEVCDAESTGFVDLDSDTGRADDQVVSVLFTPPQGPKHAVVLAESCVGVDVAGCAAALGAGGTAECRPVAPGDVLAENESELQFRFPDTDALVDGLDDDRTRSGPAKIVVSQRGAPLRCELAASRCASLGGTTATTGVVACADELFEPDGTCRTRSQDIAGRFGHFVALPPPNDFEAMLTEPANAELHLTTDAAGNVLVPMDYAAILLRVQGIPIPQLARAGTNVEAFTGSGQPVVIPGDGFIASFSPEGILLPPVFTPVVDPTDPSSADLFGSVDAPRGVIRIGRRGCLGGPDEGRPCTLGSQCSSATCSAPLFDFTDRYVAGVGPVPVSGVPSEPQSYAAALDLPVPLEGLTSSSETFSFVLSEGVDGIDRNGDGDTTDFVATLRDRDTGSVQPIGAAGAAGRAAVRVRQAPFAFPAITSEADVVGFLEPEAGQGNVDTNANGQVFEGVLRAFRLGETSAEELTDGLDPPTVDAATAFDGESLALSDGLLFFRTQEASQAATVTTRESAGTGAFGFVSEPAGTTDPTAISADGRYVAFTSVALTLLPAGTDTNGVFDVLVRDRLLGQTVRVSVSSSGAQANQNCSRPAMSSDGRFVIFQTTASTLVSGDTNGVADLFLHDRDFDGNGVFDEPGGISTTRVNVSSSGTQAGAAIVTGSGAISADGRYVAFTSSATNLVSPDSNGSVLDAFVHDRVTGGTVLVSSNASGIQADANTTRALVSRDGRFVALLSAATNLVAGDTDTNGFVDVFVRDRDRDEDGVYDEPGEIEVTRVNVSSTGAQANFGTLAIELSPDGRFVVFNSPASSLVPGDTNSVSDTFVHDRETRQTTRVSVSSAGVQSSGVTANGTPSISLDGRFVAFASAATNLVASDTNGVDDVFVHDRQTGQTVRASVSSAGVQGNNESRLPDLSGDGSFLSFFSQATNLFVGDAGANRAFVRGASPGDLGADLSGDGVLDDTVLRVADTESGPPATISDLCPASLVAAAAGRAAFLRPEAAGATSNAGCTGPSLSGPDLNGDALADDEVVHLYAGGAVSNLRCAASDLALSPTRLAALVDGELALRSPTAPAPGACSDPSWLHTGLAAEALDVSGDRVAILTAEAAQGADLNGDLVPDDRVVRLVDGSTGALVPLVDGQGAPIPAQAAEEMVVGQALVAFRTTEAAQGATDLNQDGDATDAVLRAYDLVTGTLYDSGFAATPCRLIECDPTKPYRLTRDTIRFLVFEAEQGADLNDDTDQLDLLIALFNVLSGEVEIVGEVVDPGLTLESPTGGVDPLETPSEADPTLPSTQVLLSQGRCSVSGEACAAGLSEPSGCDPGESCLAEFTVIGVSDGDADQIPDALDVCPTVPNPDQADADEDGAGDGCDLTTCGNGVVESDPATGEPFETCDDGNLEDGDGCSRLCHVEPSAPVCDADGDFDIDQADVSAILAARGQTPVPGDRRDADGDGRITVLDARRCAVQCELICTVGTGGGGGCGLLGIEPFALLLALRAGRRWSGARRT